MSSVDFVRLQKDIYRRDWKTSYLLYESGVPGFYHLGEKDKPELHLQAARAYQVMDFVRDRAPKMFRFKEQTNNWDWMHYLKSFWFYESAANDYGVYYETLTSAFKSHFDPYNLPNYSGIYVVTDARPNPEILYVGRTRRSIRDRWRNHHRTQDIAKISPLICIHCFNYKYLQFSLERAEILFSRQLQPSLNKRIG